MCTARSVRPSNTDAAHRIGPSCLLRKFGRSRGAVFSIERPTRTAAYAQLAMQTLALCAEGVQPRLRRDVCSCRQPGAERSRRVYTAGKMLKSPMATCGGAAGQLRASAREAVKGLTTYDGNPRVGVRTGARHEDGRYTDMIWFSKCRGPIAAVVLLNQTKRW